MDKDFVKFRVRERESGLKSIFLSYYYRGKRHEESLRLYLVPEHTAADRKKNKETWQIAEMVKARKLTEINENVFQLKKDTKVYTLQFFSEVGESKKAPGSRKVWKSAVRKLESFLNGRDILISDVDDRFAREYLHYLSTEAVDVRAYKHESKIGVNSQWMYYRYFKTMLNEAVKRKLITTNPCQYVENPRKKDAIRTFLTLEELNILANTDTYNKEAKRQFLFSCLTGLRFSDVQKLKWSEVVEMDGFTRLVFTQKKTSEVVYFDINPQAVDLLGSRGKDGDRVFKEMTASLMNYSLNKWMIRAGLKKHISFHCARHTFATLLITLGTDLYTVSKLLGHTNISTTQIYAKVLDKSKQEAVNRIHIDL